MKDTSVSHDDGHERVSILTDDPYQFEDDPSSCGCSPFVPAGARGFFLIFSLISITVAGGVMYGIFKLCEWLS